MINIYKSVTLTILIEMINPTWNQDYLHFSLLEGTNATLEFNFASNPKLPIFCYKDQPSNYINFTDSKITAHLNGSNFYLYIRHLQLQDIGYYFCKTSLNTPKKGIYLHIHETPIISIDGIQINPFDVFVVADKRLFIQCYGRPGKTSITFNIHFRGKIISSNYNHSMANITFTQDDSSRILGCYDNNNGYIRANVKIHVVEMKLTYYGGALKSNSVHSFTCKLKSDVPQLVIMWFLNERWLDTQTISTYELKTTIHLQLNKTNNRNVLKCIVPGHPLLYSSAILNVTYIPENISIYPSEIEAKAGFRTDIFFQCSADGNPEAEYQWLHNNEIIASGNILTFNRTLEFQDNGLYICEAYNMEGKVIKEGILRVNSSDFQNSTSSKFEWTFVIIISIAVVLITLLFIISGIIWKKRKQKKSSSGNAEDLTNIGQSGEGMTISEYLSIDEQSDLKEPVYSKIDRKKKQNVDKISNTIEEKNEIKPTNLIYAKLKFNDLQMNNATFDSEKIITYAVIDFTANLPENKDNLNSVNIYENTRCDSEEID